MKIEKYELTKKNIYNVYLSNGEVLELNGKVITNNELLIKKDIDNELYDKLKRDNTICMLMDTSVKYIDRRLRSINELSDYLKNKEEDTIIIEEVIDKLIDYKYLDDDRFTKAFIKDKLNFTNWGDYKIKNELKRLGVNEEIIYNNMTSIDDNIFYEMPDNPHRSNPVLMPGLRRTPRHMPYLGTTTAGCYGLTTASPMKIRPSSH